MAVTLENLHALVEAMRITITGHEATIRSNTVAIQALGQSQAPGGGSGKLNFHAAKGLEPVCWAGRDDKKVSYREWKAEMYNYTCALYEEAKDVLDEAADTPQGQLVDVGSLLSGEAATNKALDKALYSVLFKNTSGTARTVVQSAGQSCGLQAWHDIVHYGAPRSTTDKQVAMSTVLNPKRSANESKLQLDLQKWIAEVNEFEQRFGALGEDMKMYGLKNLVPEDTFNNRMLGRVYATYIELLAHVKAITADRSLAAMREAQARPSNAKDDPMEIGQITDQVIAAIEKKGYGKGNGEQGKNWGNQEWRDKKGQGGKSDKKGAKGQGKGKGQKGKGKGSDKQCHRCKGWGHLKAQCPSAAEDTKWGVHDVGDEEQKGDEESKEEEQQPDQDWNGDDWDGEMFMLDFSDAALKTSTRNPIEVSNQFQCLDCESEAGVMVVSGQDSKGWVKVTAAMDSGAVDHVFPVDILPEIALEESPLSKAGKGYVSATSEDIPNKGQKKLRMKTREGQTRGMIVQVAPVRKPLLSAAKMNEAGNDVNLAGKNPHILNTKTGEVTKLRREGRTYLLDLWVWTGSKSQGASVFTRR